MLGEVSDGSRQSMNRVGYPIIAPTVAAGTTDGDVETSAGKRLGSDVVGVGPIQNQERLNAAAGGGLAAEIAHAAQVALAFLADVGDEHHAAADIREVGEERKHARDREQSRQTRAVIGDTRAVQ